MEGVASGKCKKINEEKFLEALNSISFLNRMYIFSNFRNFLIFDWLICQVKF